MMVNKCFLLVIVFSISVCILSALQIDGILRKEESCNGPGCDPYRNQFSNGRCTCKRNTRGRHCSKCRRNTFLLKADHPNGCLKCFCSDRTKKCRSANLFQQKLFLLHEEERNGKIELVRKDSSVFLHSFKGNKSIYVEDLPQNITESLYWKMPIYNLGETLASYGGVFAYKIKYRAFAGGGSYRTKGPTVIMQGNGLTLICKSRMRKTARGFGWYVVPLLEQFWWIRMQSDRADSQEANKRNFCRSKSTRRAKRSHLMQVLANLDSILIKANPTQGAKRVSVHKIWLTQGTMNSSSTGQMLEVEQCSCPEGYAGLSCQRCADGFKKFYTNKSLLGFDCVHCECNGNSDYCQQDTGYCTSCQNDTIGHFCEKKLLRCHQNGTLTTSPERCLCKSRVTGKLCDSCRKGSFSLSADSQHGCRKCWCNQVTTDCSPSNLARTTIQIHPAFINLEDVNRLRRAIPTKDGEANYVVSNGIGSLRWLLPKRVTGNLLKSYGGKLQLSVYNEGKCASETHLHPLLKMEGHSLKSINWKFNPKIVMNKIQSYIITLSENNFHYMGLKMSRNSFLKVLSSVENIYIYTPRCSGMNIISIRNISLDTAINGYKSLPFAHDISFDTAMDGLPLAHEVEQCKCPEEYSGLSCENCAVGYTRDYSKRCIRKIV